MATPAATLQILVEAQTRAASMKIDRFERKLKGVDNTVVKTNADVDKSSGAFSRMGAKVVETNQGLSLLSKSATAIKWPAMIAGAGAAAQGVGALAGGAAALTGSLAPTVGLLSQAGVALGVFGQIAGVKALAGIDDLTSAVGGLNEKMDKSADAFKALSPEAKKFAGVLDEMKEPLLDVQRHVQSRLFDGMALGIQKASKNLPVLKRVLGDTAAEMSKLSIKAGEFVGSKGFGRDFKKIGQTNNLVLRQMGQAGINLAHAFMDVMVAARPLTKWLSRLALGWTESLKGMADAGRASGGLADFFTETRDVTSQLLDLLGSLGEGLWNIVQLGKPLGDKILVSLVDAAEAFAKWTASAKGRNTIADYFKQIEGPLYEAGRLVRDVVKAFFSLGGESGNTLKKLLHAVRVEMLPAMAEMAKSTTKVFGPVFVKTMTQVVELFGTLAGSSGPLVLYVRMIGRLAEGVNFLVKNLPGFKEFVVTAMGLKTLGWLGMGKASGKMFGKGFGSGVFLGAILFGPELLEAAYNFGKKVGRVIKDAIKASGVKDLVKQALNIDKVQPEDVNVGKALAAGNITIDKAAKMLKHRGETAKHTEKVIQKALGLSERNIQEHGEIVEYTAKKSSANWSGFGEKLVRVAREMSRKGRHEVDELSGGVVDDLGWAAEKGTEKSGDLRRGVGGNFKGLAGTIRRGLENIKENTNKSLGAFGADKLKFQLKVAKEVGGFFGQRGGPIDQGKASGDSVPAMLERGEYVLNRNAVSGIGKEKLDAINFGKYARFQAGGVAGLQPGISRLASWAADHHGLRISSGLRPGPAGASLHNTGEAVDLIPPGMAATKGIFASFRNQLAELFYDPWGGFDSGQMIGPIGGHLDHIHAAILGGGSGAAVKKLARMILKGPKGPLRSMGQSALDKVHSAANKYLSRQTMSSHGDIGNISGPLQAIARRMVEARWGSGQWPFFNDLVMRESGWDPTAVNPSSGAAGLAQALPPSKYPAGAWPYTGKSSAAKQLQWMIEYISGRYGTPAGAIAFHNANNWYQKGGEVLPYLGQFHGGGPVLQDGLLHAQKGEFVMPSVEHRRHELRHAARMQRELEKQIEKRSEKITDILDRARSTNNERLEHRLRARVDDLRGKSTKDKQETRALTRQVELLEALLEQTKSAEAEARERYRLERQTGAAFRDTGKRLIYDIFAGEVGSAMNRTRGWAGRGQLTETGRR